MNTAYVVVTMITIVLTTAIALPDYVPAQFVLANSAQLGVPRSWLPTLGTLKLAGAVGLAIGLAGIRSIGVAAAAGLVLFFVGAVITHIRARVLYNVAFPATYLLLSTATLVLTGTQ